jgi:hypothetical protein
MERGATIAFAQSAIRTTAPLQRALFRRTTVGHHSRVTQATPDASSWICANLVVVHHQSVFF